MRHVSMRAATAIAALFSLVGAVVTAACGGGTGLAGPPKQSTMSLMLLCAGGSRTVGSLTVTATCAATTASNHTSSITLTATGGGTASAHSTNASIISVTPGSAPNQFVVKAASVGSATVHVSDSSSDDVGETEEADEVDETPEPAESETPEASPTPSLAPSVAPT